MAYTHQREAGQVAVSDVIVELALPLVVAPEVRIVLIVAAEVDVGQVSEVRIERGHLHLTSGIGIRYRSGYRTDPADVICEKTVVPDCPTGLEHCIKNVAILDTIGRIGRGVVPDSGEYVGCTSQHARGGVRVLRGTSRTAGGVTRAF